jgi:hypothetical protein
VKVEMREVWEVDADGNIIDLYRLSEWEIEAAKEKGRFMLELDRGKFYRPKYNHSLGQWEETDQAGLEETLSRGRKDNEINELKNYLQETDFYYVRELETKKPIPADVRTKRLEARNRLNELGL